MLSTTMQDLAKRIAQAIADEDWERYNTLMNLGGIRRRGIDGLNRAQLLEFQELVHSIVRAINERDRRDQTNPTPGYDADWGSRALEQNSYYV